ncbi:hypothetical protein MMC34_004070 [Xylographa carneopallida]|nr:hypothetical protein [Xylographa carneopallida]
MDSILTARPFATSSLSLPINSYIYCIKPVGRNLAAISSDDSLRVFDPVTLQVSADRVFENAHAGVVCLENVSADTESVVTAGRDGYVRCWDLRIGKRTVELKDEKSTPFLSLAVAPGGTAVAAGTELTHSQATVQICTDGLVNVYDTTITDEDDSLIEVFNHEASIHHAGFLTDTDIYALSHDEQLSIYHLSSPDEETPLNNEPYPIVFGDMRPRLSCEYIVDIPTSVGSAVVAAGSRTTSTLDLIPLRHTVGWGLDISGTVRLSKAHGEETMRTVSIDSQVRGTTSLRASLSLTLLV